jgi:hypothetical protein
MKLLKRVIILAIAAVLGAVVYTRFYAVSEIVTHTTSRSTSKQNESPIGKIGGGIGEVRNPYEARPHSPSRRHDNY